VSVMTLSAREMTPLAGSGNAVQYGVGVAVVDVGGFHSWRFVRVPGEGDMTSEEAYGCRDGRGYRCRCSRGRMRAVERGRRRWAAIRVGACDVAYVGMV
jgi:hypothetical protein